MTTTVQDQNARYVGRMRKGARKDERRHREKLRAVEKERAEEQEDKDKPAPKASGRGKKE